MHAVSDGLFAEIEALRKALKRSYCLHRVRLDMKCFEDCRHSDVRALIADAAARSAPSLSGLEGMAGLSNE